MNKVSVVSVMSLSSCVDYLLLFFFVFCFCLAAKSWKKRLGFVLLVDTMGRWVCIMGAWGFMIFFSFF